MESKRIKMNVFLKSARLMKGLTQDEVASKLGYASPQYVSNWERGICLPSKKRVKDVCNILGIEKSLYLDVYMAAKREQLMGGM